MQVTSFMDKMQ